MIIEGNITLGRGIKVNSFPIPFGEAVFLANTIDTYTDSPRLGTANATYRWTVPDGVTSISVLCVGGGGAGGGGILPAVGGGSSQGDYSSSDDARYYSGGGGGGGGLAYSNNLTVVPGTEYIIQVGGGGTKIWSPYDANDPIYSDPKNSWGVPLATDGGASFFTTNAAIVAHQTPLVQANGGKAGFTNAAPVADTMTLQGGGGGGAAGYKGVGGAGGLVGPLSGIVAGGSGGQTSGTKKTAGFSGGAGGSASWIDPVGDGLTRISPPNRGSNAAVGSGGGAGGTAEFMIDREYLTVDTVWGNPGINYVGPGSYTGAYGGGGVGIYGAGDDGKAVAIPFSNRISLGYYTGDGAGARLNAYNKYSGSGGGDNRYDQTRFEYSYLSPDNVPGLGPMSQNGNGLSMSQGAAYGGGGGADFNTGYIQQGYTGNYGGGGLTGTFAPLPGFGVGGPGAVRIVWPGTTRQFPSTRVQRTNHRSLSDLGIDQDTSCEIEIICVAGGGSGGAGRYYTYSRDYYWYAGGGGGGGGGMTRTVVRVEKGTTLVFYLGAGGSFETKGGDTVVEQIAPVTGIRKTITQAIGGGNGGPGWVNGGSYQAGAGGSGGGAGGACFQTTGMRGIGGGQGTPGQGTNGSGVISAIYAATGAGGGNGQLGAAAHININEGGYNNYAFYPNCLVAGGGGGGLSQGSHYAGAGQAGGGDGAGRYQYYSSYLTFSATEGGVATGGGGGGGSGAIIYSYTDYYGAHYTYSSALSAHGGSGTVFIRIAQNSKLSYTFSNMTQSPLIYSPSAVGLTDMKQIQILNSGSMTFS